MPDYVGPERRKDYTDLDEALENVERLHGAVTSLATAVTNTVPRAEIEALKVEVRRDFQIKLYFMAGLSLCIIIVLIVFMTLKFNGNNNAIRHGHGVIECLMGKTEVQRTGENVQTSLATCDQTVKP